MAGKAPPQPAVDVEHREDDSLILHCPLPLGPVAQSLCHLFDEVTARGPDAAFMKQRDDDGQWRSITYGEAQRAANGLAQWLIDEGIGFGDCVAYLSEPSIEHGIAAIGIQRCGAAIAPVSPAYSLSSVDHAQLRQCVSSINAKVAIVDDADRFGPALHSISDLGIRIIARQGALDGLDIARWNDVIATQPGPEVAVRMAKIAPNDLARIIYTSGSTGSPKATPQSHANLTITIAQCEALNLLDFGGERPQLLEAMPFSHIMAGNFNFNNVIAAGGTIWIDDGKPTPALIGKTIRNLQDVSPHYAISVPLGLSMLCDAFEADAELNRKFFANLKFIGFGGALLAPSVKSRLESLSVQARGEAVPIYSFYGATEYLFGTLKYWTGGSSDTIGLPLPAIDLKLVPLGDRFEMRVKGPTLMPQSGYLGSPEASVELFDEEGFYGTGDAVRFADPDDPSAGLIFAGRLSEDFKLASGTYVQVEALRQNLLNACRDVLAEAVICGLNQEYPTALVWLKGADKEAAKSALTELIPKFNAAQGGSARQIGALFIQDAPPSFDAGEVTVKGNVAQRVVRERRSADIQAMYEGLDRPALLHFGPGGQRNGRS
ncbi:Long-chain-fatty-acid--CoA ligase [Sphingobium chlorophenolicum L-1]|uniref:Long-chain-fatty-acid--CoA ligase n=1 Tax=Sphingobium chlorophenolicum L-1 TaxID=690566 RepID=F6EUH9_SPHCR|nr:AMP-binding protein [Sphingobium chlorophenolicum]AEG47873.1 Long-chain-fatty-acid--CoA ligase [Sphingobium chlorophenolicum L-1]